jgi:altronate dehydratase large subunit
MSNNIDVDASTVLEGESLDSVGERIAATIRDVADGRLTAAERRGMEEFAINEIQPNELAGVGGRA